MNESFINISFTPAEVLFIGVVALFIFIIFGGRNDDEDSDNGDSLNVIKPLVGKFESDEDLGQYVRALANANQASTKRNTCLLYTSPSPRDQCLSRMPSSA